MIIRSVVSHLFIVLNSGELLKIKRTGGGGQNMFALKQENGVYSGLAGYDYWQGSQAFSSSVTCLATIDGFTFVGFNDGRVLKVKGTGGGGQNMFAVVDSGYGNPFSSVVGYPYWVGSDKFNKAVTGIYEVSGGMLILLENGTLIKIKGAGGSGQSLFALKEENGSYSGLARYDYWQGSQNLYSPWRFVKELQNCKDDDEFADTLKKYSGLFNFAFIINNSDKPAIAKSEDDATTLEVAPKSWHMLPFDGITTSNPSKGKVVKCYNWSIAYINSKEEVSCYPLGGIPLSSPPDDKWNKVFEAAKALQEDGASTSPTRVPIDHTNHELREKHPTYGDINIDPDIERTV